MALQNEIGNEIAAGRLGRYWTTDDLVANAALSRNFAATSLRTIPPNYSISLTGLGLGNGHNVNHSNPTYFRVGRRNGAVLYALPIHVSTPSGTVDSAVTVFPTTSDDTGIEAIVEDEVPLNQESQLDVIGNGLSEYAIDVLKQLVTEMQVNSPWDDRLQNYLWKSRTFFQTQDDLADLIWKGSIFSRLILAKTQWTHRDNLAVVNWASAIFEWGGTRQRRVVTADKVKKTLENAVSNRIVHPTAPMNSGYTKIASFGTAYLEEGGNFGIPQVINDTRVATSLTHRLDLILRQHKYTKNPSELFLGLGKVEAARGGTRPRSLQLNWTNAYQSWHGQFAATTIVANIRDILNRDPDFPRMPSTDGEETSPWTMRGVEAVLFMDGY